MNFDEMKDLWREQSNMAATHDRADPETTLNEVKEKSRRFDRTVFWRDFRELAATLMVLGFLFARGPGPDGPFWAWLVSIVLIVFAGGFFLASRIIVRGRRELAATAGVAGALDHALAQWRMQSWLLRNIMWWYILPLVLAMEGAFVTLRGWEILHHPLPHLIALPVFVGGYFLNRAAERRQIQPHLNDLEELRSQFTES